jgi:hypothetical protein
MTVRLPSEDFFLLTVAAADRDQATSTFAAELLSAWVREWRTDATTNVIEVK